MGLVSNLPKKDKHIPAVRRLTLTPINNSSGPLSVLMVQQGLSAPKHDACKISLPN